MLATKTANGITLSLEEGDAQVLTENFSANDLQMMDFVCEMLGEAYQSVAPDAIGALTSAPIFTDDLILTDDGSIEHIGNVWWYPNYQVSHFVEVLLRDNEVFFPGAPENTK